MFTPAVVPVGKLVVVQRRNEIFFGHPYKLVCNNLIRKEVGTMTRSSKRETKKDSGEKKTESKNKKKTACGCGCLPPMKKMK